MICVIVDWQNQLSRFQIQRPQSLAASLGIKLTTARKIVFDAMKQQDLRNMIDIMVISRPRGGVQNVKVDEELREAISSIIGRSSAVTLRTINSQLRKLPDILF